MTKKYKPWSPTQAYLLPPSPTQWLPEDHLVYFVLDLVAELDLSAIERVLQAKDPRGTRPYSPHMMVALLLYGYCVGVFSSRKLEKATYEDVAFRVLCANNHPDHTRISEFRRVHLDALTTLFLQVLKLCQRAGLVTLGHVALDGTKIQANASKHKAMSYERMEKNQERLQKEIDVLLKRAETTDSLEDERYGRGVSAEQLPQELKRREDRLATIKKAKAELEREARYARAAHLEQMAEVNRGKASDPERPDKYRESDAKRAAEQERQAAKLKGDDDDEPPPSHTSRGLPNHRPNTTVHGKPEAKAQRNFTDPDSRIMKDGRGAFIQGYNCQTAVDEAHQIIVAVAVGNKSPDNGNLMPMLKQTQANCGHTPKKMSADSGYWSPEVPAEADDLGTQVYIATEARKERKRGVRVTEGKAPPGASAHEAMWHKVRTEEGRKVYARRKVIVEPVHGQQKEARGFRRFLLRGLKKVQGEFDLVCTAHNILKLFRANQRRLARAG